MTEAFFPTVSSEKQVIDKTHLHRNNHRNAKHKFLMLGFMPDRIHGEQHGGGAAERRNQEQGVFRNTPKVFFRVVLVCCRYDDRNKINNN